MPDAMVTVNVTRADLDGLDALSRVAALVRELQLIPGVEVEVYGSLEVNVRARPPFDGPPVDIVNAPPNATPEEVARIVQVHRDAMADLAAEATAAQDAAEAPDPDPADA